MAVEQQERGKIDEVLGKDPNVTIFLRPIAPPAALGLAGFSGSTFIGSMYIAEWWGNKESPIIFFPFVMLWGGLGQFIAGFFGYHARDTLATIVHVLWGSFWLSIGLLHMLQGAHVVPLHSTMEKHFPELAAWFVVLAFFTWSGAVAAAARDVIYCGVLTTLASGATIACCLFSYGQGVERGMKAAAYFWIVSAILGWWRVTAYLLEEAYGDKAVKFWPIFRLPIEKKRPLMAPGMGEPGVKRGMPGLA